MCWNKAVERTIALRTPAAAADETDNLSHRLSESFSRNRCVGLCFRTVTGGALSRDLEVLCQWLRLLCAGCLWMEIGNRHEGTKPPNGLLRAIPDMRGNMLSILPRNIQDRTPGTRLCGTGESRGPAHTFPEAISHINAFVCGPTGTTCDPLRQSGEDPVLGLHCNRPTDQRGTTDRGDPARDPAHRTIHKTLTPNPPSERKTDRNPIQQHQLAPTHR